MNILDIYEKYNIMPFLAEHQLRVSAVADIICRNINIEVDRENIIKACLLHDMGNIVKFIIGSIKEAIDEKGIEYWHKIQNDFISKYGKDEHHATLLISKELGMSDKVCKLIDCVGFHTAKENLESNDFERKICAYADMRVTPYGVTSLEDRLSNLKERYHGANKTSRLDLGLEKDSLEEHVEARKIFESSLFEIERQIFERCNLKTEDITDEAIKLYIEDLKKFAI